MANTQEYFSVEEVEKTFSDLLSKYRSGELFLLSNGNRHKAQYLGMAEDLGGDLVFCKNLLPFPLNILLFFVASDKGIIKVNLDNDADRGKLIDVVIKVSDYGWVDIMIIKDTTENGNSIDTGRIKSYSSFAKSLKKKSTCHIELASLEDDSGRYYMDVQ